jgi:hypothetical protein
MERNSNPSGPGNENQGGVTSERMSALIPGLILVGIGALFLLDNLHIVRLHTWLDYWPVILIAIGMVQLVDSNYTGGRVAGGVLMGVGGLFLADNLGYLRFNIWDLWPLILIGAGLAMLWNRATRGPQDWWDARSRWHDRWRQRTWRGGPWGGWSGAEPFSSATSFSGNVLHEYAVFGGSRRTITAQDFRGGRVACVFGGVNLDLTGAAMSGNTAVLELSTVYGGATVRIPTSWNLEVRGVGIFGGFSDQTVHPPNSPDMKRLIVRGAAIFGGATFKN